MWNGIGWYGLIGVITTSTTDISLITMVRIRVMSSSNHNTSVSIVAKQRTSGSDIAADRF